MSSEEALKLEQRIDRIAAYAPYVHCIGLVLLLLLVYFKPNNYPAYVERLGIFFLLVTFFINKTYIHAGKAVEKIRDFTEVEWKQRKKEYLIKFNVPIWFWTGCVIVILSL